MATTANVHDRHHQEHTTPKFATWPKSQPVQSLCLGMLVHVYWAVPRTLKPDSRNCTSVATNGSTTM
eukprot:15457332-Alexandrium_andersonii.AAC.1